MVLKENEVVRPKITYSLENVARQMAEWPKVKLLKISDVEVVNRTIFAGKMEKWPKVKLHKTTSAEVRKWTKVNPKMSSKLIKTE